MLTCGPGHVRRLKDGVVAEGWEASVSTTHQVLRKADRIPILPDTQSKEAPGGMCHSWGLCQETQNEGVCAFSHVLIHSFPHSFVHPRMGALSLMWAAWRELEMQLEAR